ncbi:MAG: hypothetical protein R3Y21_04045 [Mycoplasmatota bacterium]
MIDDKSLLDELIEIKTEIENVTKNLIEINSKLEEDKDEQN